jgi:hypothetical protein
MDVVKNRLRMFLQDEIVAVGGTTSRLGATSLSRGLVSDCIENLEKSTQPGDASEIQAHESLHPHFTQCDYVSEACFEGAKALFISFDPRCHINEGHLVFMTSKAGGTQLARYSTSDTFKPLVVHADRVFFRFQCRAGAADSFGYRFEVSPMRGLQVRACACERFLARTV